MTVTLDGYGGLISKNLLLGVGGNIFCAITSFVIMGQTIALIIMYFKRLFYAIVLRSYRTVNSSSRYNK